MLAFAEDREACEAEGDRFVIEGIRGECIRQADQDERDFLEQRLVFLDSAQRAEIIADLLNDTLVGVDNIVFDTNIYNEIEVGIDSFSAVVVEIPSDATNLEQEDLNAGFRSVCGRIPNSSTETISTDSGQYLACVP